MLRRAQPLEGVGPEAPTLAGTWDASALAAYVVSVDRFAGTVSFAGRLIAARGVRLNDIAGRLADRSLRAARRGFDQDLERLRADPSFSPRSPVGPARRPLRGVVHHDDVRRANGLPPREIAHDLDPVIGWLLRYQRRRIPGRTARVVPGLTEQVAGSAQEVTVRGEPLEVVLWLAGRGDVAVVNIDGAAADGFACEPKLMV